MKHPIQVVEPDKTEVRGGRPFAIEPLGKMVHVRRRRRKGLVKLLNAQGEYLGKRLGFDVLAVGPKCKRIEAGDWVHIMPGSPGAEVDPKDDDPESVELLVHENYIIAKLHPETEGGGSASA